MEMMIIKIIGLFKHSMNLRQKQTVIFITIALFCAAALCFTGCADKPEIPASGIEFIQSFHDIPDITGREIAAIEALKGSRQSFSFGKLLSNEGFILPDGTYAGFAPMLCGLLSELFGIPFILDFHDWNSLSGGIDNSTIDFTSEYEITPEQQNIYHMSDPIAYRQLGMVYDYSGVTDLTLVHGLLPLAYTPIMLTTANNELEPVISIINKYIAAGGINIFYKMYREGNDIYNRHVLYNSFSDEEKAYIDNLSGKIPIVLGTDTYPVSFYNSNENEFQGISIDVLMEITKMTGIEFEPVNAIDASWGDILEMLRTGEAALISDLIITEERKEYFIWPQTPFFSTPYAFFSKTEHPDLKLYQIEQASVGIVGWCATRQLYDQWFPKNSNIKLYDSQDDALDALERNEIDLFFNLGYILYYQQNYREKPGFKANYTFPVYNDTFFGLNKNEKVLCSIIDKTITYIDTVKISNDWTSRSFDYSRILAEEQSRHANQRTMIVSIAAAILLLLIFILFLQLIKINKTEKKASVIFETNPQINVLFDSSFNVVDCNPAALHFMDFETKEELFAGFFERFSRSLPNIQPNGRISIPVSERLKIAAKEGYNKVETEIKIGDNTKNLLVEFVRIPYGSSFALIAYAYDMTEMRNREKELIKAQKTNEQYLSKVNLMLKATQIALWDMYVLKDDPVNPKNEVIYSDEFRYMLGYSNENDFPNIINSWSDKLHPEDKERSVNAFAAHMLDKTGNTPFDIEYRLLKKNGEYSYFHAYGETIRDKDGSPLHVAGSLIDVTDRVNILHNNERQLTLLNAVVKATKIGLYDVGINNNDFAHPDNTVTFTNEFRNMLGYENETDFPDTLENWKNHLHPDDREEAIAYVIRHVSDKTGEMPYDAEYRLRKKDGEYAYFRACGEAIRDKDGNVIRIAGALLDITETKTTLLDKELQLTKLNLIIEAAKIGMVNMEFDPNDPLGPNNHIELSDEYKKLLGYTDDDDKSPETLGESRIGLVHPDDMESSFKVFSAHILDKTGNTPFDIEQRLRKKNGEYAWFRTVGKAIRDNEGNPIRFVNAAFDMTETRNLINEAEKQRMEAEIASRSKSNFLANMSHEMRTPMNAIIGMTTIGKKADDIIQKNHALNKIGDASSHLLAVINDVLDMAKIEANRLELAPIEYNFKKMLQKVLTVINFRVDEKKQQLTLNVDSKIPLFIFGDDQRLSQVITNLLSNAVKFTPEGGKIHLDASLVNEINGICELRIEVADSGIGISPDKHEKLFSAFEQAESGTSRQYGGTGLGLSISRHIVEYMDGKIWVESELGKGAKFIFTVKARRSDKSPISILTPDNSWNNTMGSGELRGKNLLVAEDVDINREILIALLEDTGISIDCAENGEEAFKMIEAAPDKYDIIFMDVQMPVMNGYEATRQIRSLPERQRGRLPIIALTANVFKSDIEDCLAAGMDDHLGKPLDIDKVMEKLRIYLK